MAKKMARNEGDEGLDVYLQEVGSYKPLDIPEERELVGQMQSGDSTAKKKLIRANLRLVISIAQEYVDRGIPLLDLIEEGNIGLINALSRFDLSRGVKLATYASYWIRKYISEAIAEKSSGIRIPTRMGRYLTEWRAKAGELAHKLGREPTSDEIASLLMLPPRTLRAVQRAAASYSRPPVEDEEQDIEEIGDKLAKLSRLDRSEILDILDRELIYPEGEIIKLRFGISGEGPLTQAEIGRRVGYTKARVEQLEKEALRRLRRYLASEDYED